jgi:hypothetical protein
MVVDEAEIVTGRQVSELLRLGEEQSAPTEGFGKIGFRIIS